VTAYIDPALAERKEQRDDNAERCSIGRMSACVVLDAVEPLVLGYRARKDRLEEIEPARAVVGVGGDEGGGEDGGDDGACFYLGGSEGWSTCAYCSWSNNSRSRRCFASVPDATAWSAPFFFSCFSHSEKDPKVWK
jgi:hypothetical protein